MEKIYVVELYGDLNEDQESRIDNYIKNMACSNGHSFYVSLGIWEEDELTTVLRELGLKNEDKILCRVSW